MVPDLNNRKTELFQSIKNAVKAPLILVDYKKSKQLQTCKKLSCLLLSFWHARLESSTSTLHKPNPHVLLVETIQGKSRKMQKKLVLTLQMEK